VTAPSATCRAAQGALASHDMHTGVDRAGAAEASQCLQGLDDDRAQCIYIRWRHDSIAQAAVRQAVQCLQHPQMAAARRRQAMRRLQYPHAQQHVTFNQPQLINQRPR